MVCNIPITVTCANRGYTNTLFHTSTVSNKQNQLETNDTTKNIGSHGPHGVTGRVSETQSREVDLLDAGELVQFYIVQDEFNSPDRQFGEGKREGE